MQLPHFRSRFHNKWGVGGLFVALIVRAQLLVSQHGGNLIVATCAAVDDFVGRLDHPIHSHTNAGQSFSCKQLPSRSILVASSF